MLNFISTGSIQSEEPKFVCSAFWDQNQISAWLLLLQREPKFVCWAFNTANALPLFPECIYVSLNSFGPWVLLSILCPINGNILNICASELLLRFLRLLCGSGVRGGLQFQLILSKWVLCCSFKYYS
jgi:hypothetical protein